MFVQSQGPPRHPRFGGVFVRRSEGGLGSTFLYSNPLRQDVLGALKSQSPSSKQARCFCTHGPRKKEKALSCICRDVNWYVGHSADNAV